MTASVTGTHVTYDGIWTKAKIPHVDIHDIGFLADNTPWLLASDGGLASFAGKDASGALVWNASGYGPDGYNALQISEVRHQEINNPNLSEVDLYYGTQDNGFRASLDNGLTWLQDGFGGEGDAIQAEPVVADPADAQITLRMGAMYENFLTGRGLANPCSWENPTGKSGELVPDSYTPVIWHKDFHFQAFANTDGQVPSRALAVSTDAAAKCGTLQTHWTMIAQFPESLLDAPKLSTALVRFNPHLPLLPAPVAYLPIITGFSADHQEMHGLLRIEKAKNGYSTRYPAMRTFRVIAGLPFRPRISLGISRTHYFGRAVFAVDPGNSLHLFAPDMISHQMMETKDGGDNWVSRPDMTSLVTQNGNFLFDDGAFLNTGAIAFNPQNPDKVAFGTRQSGVFVSADGGATWEKLAGSELATFVSSIEWVGEEDLIVSTQGRGLWRAHRYFETPRVPICLACDFWPRELEHPDGPSWNPELLKSLDQTLVVLNGRLQGVRMDGERLVEVFITPGATIGWRSLDKSPLPAIAVTYSQQPRGFTGLRFSAAKRSANAFDAGLIIGRDGHVAGLVTSTELLSVDGARPAPKPLVHMAPSKPVGSPRSPTAGKPYLVLAGADARHVAPGAQLQLYLSGMTSGSAAEVQVDGRPAGHERTGDHGAVSLHVVAPEREGLHAIEVRDPKTNRIVAGLSIVVARGDERERRNGE